MITNNRSGKLFRNSPSNPYLEMAIQWQDKYRTGVDPIDSQHQKIFEFCNKLEELIEQGIDSGPKVDNLLMFLTTYAKTHFIYEENCMFKHACPAAKANRDAHARFLGFLSESQAKRYSSESTLDWMRELSGFLEKWLDGHICQIDVKLRKCIQKRASNESASNSACLD